MKDILNPFIPAFQISSFLNLGLNETHLSDQVNDQVSDQVKALIKILKSDPLSAIECMTKLKLTHRPTFRKNYLNPALAAGKIERTIPEKPNSRLQKYQLSL